MSIRIPWRRVVWLAVILVPVAVAGTLLWLSTRDLSRYQAKLTDQIRNAMGIEGDSLTFREMHEMQNQRNAAIREAHKRL